MTRRLELTAGLFVSAFVLWHSTELTSLQHNFDEGVNVYAARLIQQGQVPFRDFFYQQPALYIYLLSLLPTNQIWYGRLVSLLAAAASALVLLAIARHTFGARSWAPFVAVALFSGAGLQYFDLLALPVACMLLFGLLAAWLLCYRPGGLGAAASAGVCLALAIHFKPIALALAVALALALTVDPRRRRLVVPLTLVTGVVGLMGLALWHVVTAGAFTELIVTQTWHRASLSQVEAMATLPGLRDVVPHTAPAQNVLFYLLAFEGHLDLLMVAGALAGAWILWRGGAVVPRAHAVLWTAWLLLPVLFSFLVWRVAMEHYHVLLLPPLALLTSVSVERLAERGGLRRAAAGLLCAAVIGAGLLSTHARQKDYGPVAALRGGAPVVAFDPLVNVLSETEAACGVMHFILPPYEAQLRGESSYEESRDRLVRCLEASPEVRIAIHQLSDLGFVHIDRTLRDYVLRQPRERVIFLTPGAEEAFVALFPRPR